MVNFTGSEKAATKDSVVSGNVEKPKALPNNKLNILAGNKTKTVWQNDNSSTRTQILSVSSENTTEAAHVQLQNKLNNSAAQGAKTLGQADNARAKAQGLTETSQNIAHIQLQNKTNNSAAQGAKTLGQTDNTRAKAQGLTETSQNTAHIQLQNKMNNFAAQGAKKLWQTDNARAKAQGLTETSQNTAHIQLQNKMNNFAAQGAKKLWQTDNARAKAQGLTETSQNTAHIQLQNKMNNFAAQGAKKLWQTDNARAKAQGLTASLQNTAHIQLQNNMNNFAAQGAKKLWQTDNARAKAQALLKNFPQLGKHPNGAGLTPALQNNLGTPALYETRKPWQHNKRPAPAYGPGQLVNAAQYTSQTPKVYIITDDGMHGYLKQLKQPFSNNQNRFNGNGRGQKVQNQVQPGKADGIKNPFTQQQNHQLAFDTTFSNPGPGQLVKAAKYPSETPKIHIITDAGMQGYMKQPKQSFANNQNRFNANGHAQRVQNQVEPGRAGGGKRPFIQFRPGQQQQQQQQQQLQAVTAFTTLTSPVSHKQSPTGFRQQGQLGENALSTYKQSATFPAISEARAVAPGVVRPQITRYQGYNKRIETNTDHKVKTEIQGAASRYTEHK